VAVEAVDWWFIAMERSCQTQLLADAEAVEIDPEQAQKIHAVVGSE